MKIVYHNIWKNTHEHLHVRHMCKFLLAFLVDLIVYSYAAKSLPNQSLKREPFLSSFSIPMNNMAVGRFKARRVMSLHEARDYNRKIPSLAWEKAGNISSPWSFSCSQYLGAKTFSTSTTSHPWSFPEEVMSCDLAKLLLSVRQYRGRNHRK